MRETEDLHSYLDAAESYFEKRRYDEAAEICREGLRKSPDFLPGRLLLGRCYLQEGKIQEAQTELEYVAETIEKCSPVYKNLSRVYLEGKNPDWAMAALRKALAISLMGDALFKVPCEEGMPELPLSIKGQDRDARSSDAEGTKAGIQTDTLADIYVRQGHLGKALSILEEILTRNPGNAPVREKYEALLKKSGRMKDSSRAKVIQELERWLLLLGGRARVVPPGSRT